MSEKKIEVCAVCGVKIEGNEKVLFSAGAPGDRARLWARVCQYVEKEGCINKDRDRLGTIKPSDRYIPLYFGEVAFSAEAINEQI